MTETTKTAPAKILYNAFSQQVTIRVKDGGVIVMRLQDALQLGWQLINLLNRIDSAA
jgi:hypothetical protein